MSLPRDLMGRKRMEMPLATRGVPGVPLLGRYNYAVAMPELAEHAHVGTLEICFLVKGRQTYQLGGASYRLSGGDVFIAFPGEKHSTGGLPEEKGILYWIALRPPSRGGFLGASGKPGADLWRALLGIKNRHFQGSWKMKESLDAVTEVFHRSKGRFDAFAMTNYVGAFLLEVLEHAEEAKERRTVTPLRPVIEHIERKMDEPLSVPFLAELAGMSVARFKARFKEEMGVPPGEYVLRTRIAAAQSRLRESILSITEVGYGVGFSSSQYFATVFQRFTGQTPTAYRKQEGRGAKGLS